jgi:hypothetical protein
MDDIGIIRQGNARFGFYPDIPDRHPGHAFVVLFFFVAAIVHFGLSMQYRVRSTIIFLFASIAN